MQFHVWNGLEMSIYKFIYKASFWRKNSLAQGTLKFHMS